MVARVMIVDDEEDLVWTMVRQIPRQRPRLIVEGFCDPTEALERLRVEPPDVLVTDLRMPKLGGIDLLIAARQAAPRLPVVVMTAFNTAHVRREVMKQGGVQFLEKPFELPVILEALDVALGSREGFQGAVSLPMLPDLVQLYAMGRVTGALRITNGERTGILWFDSGEIVHAEHRERRGTEAFYEMLRWEGGHFEMDGLAKPSERTIESRWQGLLLEGCRLMDEERARGQAASAVGAAPVPATQAPGRVLNMAAVSAALTVSLPGAWPAEPGPGRDGTVWRETLDELARAAAPLSDSHGSGVVELVATAAGFALFWNGADRLGFGMDLSGREATVRFRAGVERALRAERLEGRVA